MDLEGRTSSVGLFFFFLVLFSVILCPFTKLNIYIFFFFLVLSEMSRFCKQSSFPGDHRELVPNASESVQHRVQRLSTELHRHRGNRLVTATTRILHLQTTDDNIRLSKRLKFYIFFSNILAI